MRCLIVEDYVELAELWRLELADLGFEAVAVHSAEAAFARMLTTPFDLVIADLGLPDGSGLTVAQSAAIRAPGAAVIVVTGQAEYPHGELFGMSGNIVAVFRKTSDLNDMLAFADHLRAKHARAQAPAASPPPSTRPPEPEPSHADAPAELARLRAAG
ncbi:response regulator [Albimonas sp. CAU 1670]|uniref:response regulator n=1 Tax=Albimonas sp. CAU 1670 TaxID=3032599 RepID=UPI0023DA4E0D|nr:response regulator [Albimonas sp. CAU 1670]MDF2232141.1 response regulator [Albimonas sp. CAU 1670]